MKGIWDPLGRRLWLAETVFVGASALLFGLRGDWAAFWACVGSLFLVAAPVVLPKLLGIRLSKGFFICCMLYALGPMLGKAYRLYYLTSWWDKLLHTMGGVVFAAIGMGIARKLGADKGLSILFGFFFSVAVSGLWELFEFGMDTFFGMDMQNDRIVHSIHSYVLGDAPGTMGLLENIREVTVNGMPLELGGYLDIGLIDSMGDMLVETVGAAVFALYARFSAGAGPVYPPDAKKD